MTAEKGDDIPAASRNVTDDSSGGEQIPATNAALGEGLDVYGDIATAQKLGYVHRGYDNPVYMLFQPNCNLLRTVSQAQVPTSSIYRARRDNRDWM